MTDPTNPEPSDEDLWAIQERAEADDSEREDSSAYSRDTAGLRAAFEAGRTFERSRQAEGAVDRLERWMRAHPWPAKEPTVVGVDLVRRTDNGQLQYVLRGAMPEWPRVDKEPAKEPGERERACSRSKEHPAGWRGRDEMSYRADFLEIRRRYIRELVAEGETIGYITRILSMDPGQVQLISMTETALPCRVTAALDKANPPAGKGGA